MCAMGSELLRRLESNASPRYEQRAQKGATHAESLSLAEAIRRLHPNSQNGTSRKPKVSPKSWLSRNRGRRSRPKGRPPRSHGSPGRNSSSWRRSCLKAQTLAPCHWTRPLSPTRHPTAFIGSLQAVVFAALQEDAALHLAEGFLLHHA